MPLDPNELAELRAYVNSPEGASDHEAQEALAEEMKPARAGNAGLRQVQNAASNPTGFHSQASAQGPATGAQQRTGPSGKGLANPPQPSTQRAGMPSFTDGKTFGGLPGEQASAGVMGPGSSLGGAVGGTIGSLGGPLGRAAGASVGGAIGNLGEQIGRNDSDLSFAVESTGTGAGTPIQTGSNDNAGKPLNWGSAAGAGAAQGAMSLGMTGAGMGIAKLGFPRIGAFVGGFTPRQGVSSVTPAAARGVSDAGLQAVDSAGAISPQAAVQQAATGAKQAAQDLPLANAAGRSAQAARAIQPQLAQGAKDLAPLNANFADTIRDAFGTMTPDQIEAGLKAGTITPQNALVMLQQAQAQASAGPGRDLVTQAFRHPQSFPQTAGDAAVTGARIPLAKAASKQGMLGSALGKANDTMSSAVAQGVGPGSAPQLAADAQGLNSIANMGVQTPAIGKLGRILEALQGQGNSSIAPVGLRGGQRATQTAAALLGERGLPSANPLSNSDVWRAANAPNGLDALLAALSQNRSKK